MRIEPEISAVSIVLLGHFNPAIFQPAWLSIHGLVASADVEQPDIRLIHPEIANFSWHWADLSIEKARFSINTTVAPYIRVSDFVAKLFGEVLPHTPIEAMGINRTVHFAVESEAQRNALGKLLAPQAPWGKLGEKLDADPPARGGMISLVMQQTNPSGREAGYIRAKIEPSPRITENRGLFMEVNDHFGLSSPLTEGDGARRIMGYLDEFDESIKNSESIVDQIMGLI